MGRRGYPPEFRRRVLDLVDAGPKVAEVALDLGVSVRTIYNWRRQLRVDRGLEPIFEADITPCSHGFRPKRRAHDAIVEIHYLASPKSDYLWVFEADIKACFDEIDHTALMGRVRDRIGDKRAAHRELDAGGRQGAVRLDVGEQQGRLSA